MRPMAPNIIMKLQSSFWPDSTKHRCVSTTKHEIGIKHQETLAKIQHAKEMPMNLRAGSSTSMRIGALDRARFLVGGDQALVGLERPVKAGGRVADDADVRTGDRHRHGLGRGMLLAIMGSQGNGSVARWSGTRHGLVSLVVAGGGRLHACHGESAHLPAHSSGQ